MDSVSSDESSTDEMPVLELNKLHVVPENHRAVREPSHYASSSASAPVPYVWTVSTDSLLPFRLDEEDPILNELKDAGKMSDKKLAAVETPKTKSPSSIEPRNNQSVDDTPSTNEEDRDPQATENPKVDRQVSVAAADGIDAREPSTVERTGVQSDERLDKTEQVPVSPARPIFIQVMQARAKHQSENRQEDRPETADRPSSDTNGPAEESSSKSSGLHTGKDQVVRTSGEPPLPEPQENVPEPMEVEEEIGVDDNGQSSSDSSDTSDIVLMDLCNRNDKQTGRQTSDSLPTAESTATEKLPDDPPSRLHEENEGTAQETSGREDPSKMALEEDPGGGDAMDEDHDENEAPETDAPFAQHRTEASDEFIREAPSLVEEEKRRIGDLDEQMLVAEEEELMVQLDDEITAAEEKELMKRLGAEIEEAERKEQNARKLRSSRVEQYFRVGDNMTEGSWTPLVKRRKPPNPPLDAGTSLSKVVALSYSDFHSATATLPKFLLGNDPLFTLETLQRDCFDRYFSRWTPSKTLGFNVEFQELQSDPNLVRLLLEGPRETVWLAMKRITDRITYRHRELALQELLSDGEHFELDIELDSALSLGVEVFEAEGKGLWVEPHAEIGQVEKALGTHVVSSGVAFVKVDGADCSTLSHLKEGISKAKSEKRSISVTVCVHKNADLSGVDTAKVSKGMVAPRRRDGTLYSGAWTFNRIDSQHEVQASELPVAVSASLAKDVADPAHSTATSDSEKHLPLAQRTTPAAGESKIREKAAAENPAQLAFHHFGRKFQAVIDVEYQEVGIKPPSAKGSMWEVHKRRYGKACDQNCLCPYILHELTEHVVKRHISNKRKKDRGWKNPHHLRAREQPVGFVSRFAPRFIPLLRQQFPEESPPDILDRLLGMWKLHQKNRNFGLRCKKNCTCIEGWELVFGRGESPSSGERTRRDRCEQGWNNRSTSMGSPKEAVTQVESRHATTKPNKTGMTKNSSNGVRHGDADYAAAFKFSSRKRHLEGTDAEGTAPPRKRNSSAASRQKEYEVHPGDTGNALAAKSSSRQRQIKGTGAKGRLPAGKRISSAPSQQIEYEVTFDPAIPLGFYCLTERSTRGVVSVKIISICPNGPCSKDARISSGTVVCGYRNDAGRTAIRKVQELIDYYHTSKAAGRHLRLLMINTNVTSKLVHDTQRYGAFDWTQNGEWQGKCKKGWAGGAREVKRGKKHASSKVGASSSTNPAPEFNNEPTTPDEPFQSEPLSWKVVEYPILPFDRQAKPKRAALSRHNGERATKKKVRFAEREEERFFQKGMKCHQSLIPITEETPGNSSSPTNLLSPPTKGLTSGQVHTSKSFFQKLDEAVSTKTSNDVIRLLEDESITRDKETADRLQAVYEQVKQALEHEKRFHTNCTERDHTELKRKKALLIIHVQALFQIQQARALKYWERLDMVVDGIEDFCSKSIRIPESAELLGSLRTRDTGNDRDVQKLGSLPRTSVTKSIAFGKDSPPPTFSFNNNKHLGAYKRELVMELGFVEADSGTETALASVHLPLDAIGKRCKSEDWQILEVGIEGGAVEGRVKTRVRRGDLNEGYVESKQHQQRKKVFEIIGWLKQFNRDANLNPEYLKLSAHIRGPGDVSLLHAAILLEDEKSIEELLNVGADPLATSDIGSAVTLAINSRHLAMEKALHAKEYLSPGDSTKRQEYERLKKSSGILGNIVEMLRAASGIRSPASRSES